VLSFVSVIKIVEGLNNRGARLKELEASVLAREKYTMKIV